MVCNIHSRSLPCSAEQAGALLGQIAGEASPLWPVDRWPAMVLDRALSVGAHGGHADVRYCVTAYTPGRRVEFTFERGGRLDGTHTLEVVPGEQSGTCVMRHVITGRLVGSGKLAWPLAIRPMHDALIEDLLDRAEASARGREAVPRRWGLAVRVIHRLVMRKLVQPPEPTARSIA
ncbi:MAG: hypothetical protein QM679_08650 [Patulibacter sp.]